MNALLCFLLLLMSHQGRVMFGNVPVPGATITAIQGENKFVTITDPQGVYFFPEVAEGPFTIQVEMRGFSSIKREVNGPGATFELKMLPIEQIHAQIVTSSVPEPAAGQSGQTGFPQTDISTADANRTATTGAFANLTADDLSRRSADAFLINGSDSNAAASPFGLPASIGNNLRGMPLFRGNAGLTVDNSGLNARSYSFTGQNTREPSYNRLTASLTLSGPLLIPFLFEQNAPRFFFSYQRTQNRNVVTTPGRMPTAAERQGDFSRTLTALGQPVKVFDPFTGIPFGANQVPRERISPQASALLNLFPLPNFEENARYNYQVPVVSITHHDTIQGRLDQSIGRKNQLAVNFDVQSERRDNSNLFTFADAMRTLAANASVQWTARFSERSAAVLRYQFVRQSARLWPYFANRLNVSGIAGIGGNNQESSNWGPPTLNYAGGTSTLSDGQYFHNRTLNNAFSFSFYWIRGRHYLNFGADVRRSQFNVLSQQNPRGSFTFSGAAAGYDFADFLLGIPDTSAIAFGNADKYFRQTFHDGFVMDDFKVSSGLTINAGIRWEYEAPIHELHGRLVNLDIASGFNSVRQAAGNGLIQPDRSGIQPRVGFAWRPLAASSLVVRGGYGIYRNTNVYQAIAMQMAQQPPFSKTVSVQRSPENPLTLANGFVSAPGNIPNTFAADPHFRVGYVQSWDFSVQRDLPATLQLTVMYLGTKGTRLPQETLPNTFPSGAVDPSGYVYLSSNGNSIRHAGTVQLRRRLRSGFNATAQYTWARSIDNAPLMAGIGTSVDTAAIAQNWLDLRAERAPSSFDQRHQFSVETQYTAGMGLGGGALVGGWRGALFRGWTSSFHVNIGKGQPLTPVYFAAVKGTGFTGNLRPDVTGALVKSAPPGLFLNPAAYRLPAEGLWGNAGRNSITGPAQFSLNSSLGRSFLWRNRYSFEFRVDAINLLNHVTVKSWNTTVNSTQFGLPSGANAMRSIMTTLRFRF
jgi:trimeric autotransporter adhesin